MASIRYSLSLRERAGVRVVIEVPFRYSLSLRERAGVRVVVDSGDKVEYRFHCCRQLEVPNEVEEHLLQASLGAAT